MREDTLEGNVIGGIKEALSGKGAWHSGMCEVKLGLV